MFQAWLCYEVASVAYTIGRQVGFGHDLFMLNLVYPLCAFRMETPKPMLTVFDSSEDIVCAICFYFLFQMNTIIYSFRYFLSAFLILQINTNNLPLYFSSYHIMSPFPFETFFFSRNGNKITLIVIFWRKVFLWFWQVTNNKRYNVSGRNKTPRLHIIIPSISPSAMEIVFLSYLYSSLKSQNNVTTMTIAV